MTMYLTLFSLIFVLDLISWNSQSKPIITHPTSRAELQTENCYMPVRTPTAEDKRNFIEQISRFAIQAESKHGVPAPALAGMAILESGYGLTRLSQDAKNIFGYKKVGGQETYTLTCQPAWDVGNQYVKFDSWADAMDFVAGRLAVSPHYRAATAKYKIEIASGVDRKTAAINWLVGISDPYNYKPTEYVTKVKRCINDPYRWSEQVDEKTTLWKLVPVTPNSPTLKPDEQKLAAVKKVFERLISSGGRYMEGNCKDVSGLGSDPALNKILTPYFDQLATKGLDFKIRDCTYESGLKGRVIMLNVDANQLAHWTMNACEPNVTDGCLNGVIHNIWLANNAQFPIAGTVAEPAKICNKTWTGHVLYAFRDGVTVGVKSFSPATNGRFCTRTQLTASQLEAVLTEPPTKHGNYVRVAGVEGKGATNKEYLDNARNSYLEALGNDEYRLLKSWVAVTRHTRQFTRLKNVPFGRLNADCWFADSSQKIAKSCP